MYHFVILTLDQDYEGVDFGMDLFSVNAETGLNANLIGYDVMATVFDARGELEFPLPNGDTLIIGGEINFLGFGSKVNLGGGGKIEIGGVAGILGGTVSFGIE